MRTRFTCALVMLTGLTVPFALSAQAPPAPTAPKKVVIVTGENSFNGHVWKDTSAELKRILDAGGAFASACRGRPQLHRERRVSDL